ncbi:transposase [uncultured Nostoc sp.]
MGQHIKQSEKELTDLKAEQQELLEKINRTSKNSSSPPSLDRLNADKRQEKKKSGKKRGGQPGHKGHSRFLYDVSECESVLDHHPQTCKCCGEKLNGEDAFPYRHQIVEIPPINPIIVEHRLHQLMCKECGTLTRATLPMEVDPRGYGVRVVAIVGVLSGLYRHSQRMVQSAMQDLFGISMSLLVQEIRNSLKSSLQEAADCEIGSAEKTPLAKTVRSCRQILKVEPALWLFVTVEGVEPTNNAAERAIRPAVIWRRTSFGSQTQAGSIFVARMLTVVTSLKSQRKNVLDFMTHAVGAARDGNPPPSLLPEVNTSQEQVINVA